MLQSLQIFHYYFSKVKPMNVKKTRQLILSSTLLSISILLTSCGGGSSSELLVSPSLPPISAVESAPVNAIFPSNYSNLWVSNCANSGICSITIPGTGQIAIQVPGVSSINQAYIQNNNLIATNGSANSTVWVSTPIVSPESITATWESADFSAIESLLPTNPAYVAIESQVFVGGLPTGSLLAVNNFYNSENPTSNSEAQIIESSELCSSTATSSYISAINIPEGTNSGWYVLVGTSSGNICSYGVTGINTGKWAIYSDVPAYTSTAAVNGIGFYVNSTYSQTNWWTADGTIWRGTVNANESTVSISILSNLPDFPTGQSVTAFAVNPNGNVYIGTSLGNIYALYSGQNVWSYPINIGTQPILNLSTPLPGTNGASLYDVYAFIAGSTTAYGISPQY